LKEVTEYLVELVEIDHRLFVQEGSGHKHLRGHFLQTKVVSDHFQGLIETRVGFEVGVDEPSEQRLELQVVILATCLHFHPFKN
jgi:hypothetical protein